MTEKIDTRSRKRGANLRKAVLERAGDTVALERLDTEIQHLDNVSESWLNNERIVHLLLNDEAVMRDFLMNIKMYGEEEGMRRLVGELERLQKTPGYDQCNFVANPFIRF